MKFALIIFVLQILVVFFSVTGAEPRSTSKKTSINSHQIKPAGPTTPLLRVPIKEWTGKKFVLLPKQKIVRDFGYGLYLTPELDKSKTTLNPELETSGRQIRCEAFEPGNLIVTAVRPSGSEYLVQFKHSPTQRALFAKTHKAAIEGLALAEDMETARRRWLGAVVFSLRRYVNTYDSSTGTVSTHKVKLCDSLNVKDIQWGTTPLPFQPLWLVVETPEGMRGFIPVCASWTNVMTDKITSGKPWEDDILEQDPKKLYNWDDIYWEAIDNHTIVSGMTKTQVRLSWGLPKIIRKDPAGSPSGETWLFDNGQQLPFAGDSLAGD